MRVLVAAYACNPLNAYQLHPGEDLIGWQLVRQLSRFHELHVISHAYNKPGVEQFMQDNPMPGVHFHFLSLSNWAWPLYRLEIGQRIYYYIWQVLAWRLARRLHRSFRFEAAHHVTFNNDWIPSFIGAFLNVPFIWGPVGGGQKTPPGFLDSYPWRGRLADSLRASGQWIGRNLLYSRHRLLRRASAILICNRETLNKIPVRYRSKAYEFPVNGIGEEAFHSKPSPKADKAKFTVLSVGRLIHWKNFEAALRTFAVFQKEAPDAEFLLVGNGPEKSRLLALAGELGILSNGRLIDWLPQQDLFLLMRSADVFLYPSLREGGGAVVVEAMAAGLPVVCIDTAGPGLHIQGESGVKIKPISPEYVVREMARALGRLYHDRDLRARMGANARKRAEEKYLWDRLGDRLQEIYQRAVGGP